MSSTTKRVGYEEIAFGSAGALLLASIAGAVAGRVRLHEGAFESLNARVRYGVDHLPAALLAGLLFLILVAAARRLLARDRRLAERPTGDFVAVLIGCFCLIWLPAVLAGGFDKDDWMLLGAASVRKTLAGHPALAWYTLDSVDGNFRPLGTVLYMGAMLRHYGVWARPFLLGLFGVNLLGSLMAFCIVRKLGYSRIAAAAAALLYMSRSMTYPIETWVCALGDALVILLCGAMAWALLEAIRRRGWAAARFHLLAWVCFAVATLAKQSAFAAPLIVGLLLFLRPGTPDDLPRPRRARAALLGLTIYGATAAVPFLHAKRLLAAESPYPIGLSAEALLRTFAYPVWYLGTFEFPGRHAALHALPDWLGLIVVCVAVGILWRTPRLLGEHPRDVVFCLLAAAASVSLFAVLPARTAPYYGSMAAFWISVGLGVALTRFGWAERPNPAARLCCFLFCALLAAGFVDVRLKQTGLFPSGGYTWGASEVGLERNIYEGIARQLARAPQTGTLVLEDMPNYDGYFAGMAMTADPGLKRILTYHTVERSFMANDREGLVPGGDPAGLRDPKAYNWSVPLSDGTAKAALAGDRVLWLRFHDGKIEGRN